MKLIEQSDFFTMIQPAIYRRITPTDRIYNQLNVATLLNSNERYLTFPDKLGKLISKSDSLSEMMDKVYSVANGFWTSDSDEAKRDMMKELRKR